MCSTPHEPLLSTLLWPSSINDSPRVYISRQASAASYLPSFPRPLASAQLPDVLRVRRRAATSHHRRLGNRCGGRTGGGGLHSGAVGCGGGRLGSKHAYLVPPGLRASSRWLGFLHERMRGSIHPVPLAARESFVLEIGRAGFINVGVVSCPY